ncbi:SIS domain-containing protein [bacterium]|nr:SIS domain-containing protein [bacterium]
MSNIKNSIKDYFQTSSNVIASLALELDTIEKIAIAISDSNANGGKVLIAGNGGSCADSEHFAGELLCTFKSRDRGPIGAINLANSSAITAWANDFEFDSYYTRQVEALGNKDDILFLITTGGGDRENGASMNLVYAAEKAKKLGLKIVTLAGKSGGILKDFSDLSIVVKSYETANIQEAQIAIIHGICYCLDEIDLNNN